MYLKKKKKKAFLLVVFSLFHFFFSEVRGVTVFCLVPVSFGSIKIFEKESSGSHMDCFFFQLIPRNSFLTISIYYLD